MNRKEAERLTHQADTLRALGFTQDEAEALRRISMTLHRWHELECGDGRGCIERDEAGLPWWVSAWTGNKFKHPDREKGALKRLAAVLKRCNLDLDFMGKDALTTYIQTDPRGAALYIIRPGDIPEGQTVESCYSRGICVY